MSRVRANLARKILSLALIFNSLVSLISLGNILVGYYAARPWWQPYSPYLLDGSLFWVAILTACLNIFPSKMVGKVHIRRLLFHHYVYGFITMMGSAFLITYLVPASLTALFMPTLAGESLSLQSLVFYTELFFLYGGLTLLLDDLPDMSSRMSYVLDQLKKRVHKVGRGLQFVHFCVSLVTVYISLAVGFWFIERYLWISQWPLWFLSHIIFILSLLVNGVWGLDVTRKKIWFQT